MADKPSRKRSQPQDRDGEDGGSSPGEDARPEKRAPPPVSYTDLLPDASTLQWYAVLDQPQLMARMITIVEPLLEHLHLYPVATPKFTGIALDESDTLNQAAAVGRLACNVKILPLPGQDTAREEVQVSLNPRVLAACLRRVRDHHTMVMYQTLASSDVCLVWTSMTGHTSCANVKLTSPIVYERLPFKPPKCKYQMKVDSELLRDIIKPIADAGATEFTLRLRQVDDGLQLLCFDGEGQKLDPHEVVPLLTVGEQDVGGEQVRESKVAGADSMQLVPRRRRDIDELPVLYAGTFQLRYMQCILKNINCEVVLFVTPDPAGTPMVVHVDLGIKGDTASYVVFIVTTKNDA